MIAEKIQTARLLLSPLSEDDHLFIKELLNTEGWIKFIGNRNIHSEEDAIAYIQKIDANPATSYRTVTLKDTSETIGLITLIQRDYLDQPDIGFAFLPAHAGKGYAYEAAREVLAHVLEDDTSSVHAVVLPDNTSSVRLVEKLGLTFNKAISVGEEELHLYTITKN